MPPVLIADVMFLNERGFWMTVYTWSYFGAVMVGPIVSGAISERFGWRSFWWLNVALYAACFAFQLCLHPETYYDRRHLVGATAAPDKRSPSTKSIASEAAAGNSASSQTAAAPAPASKHDQPVSCFRRGTPTRAQFTHIQARASRRESWLSVWTPIMLFSFPVVEWTSFAFSWSASCFLITNLTQSQVFHAPPYNMSTSAVGLTNFASLVGGTIGMLAAGPLSDWVSMRATRRNGGIREPEMRLPALVPFAIIALAGGLVVAYGYENLWKMDVIVIVGYTLLGIQATAIPAVAMTYSIDSYKPISGEILVSATVNKNLWVCSTIPFAFAHNYMYVMLICWRGGTNRATA